MSLSGTLTRTSPGLRFSFRVRFTGRKLAYVMLFTPVTRGRLTRGTLHSVNFTGPIAGSDLAPLTRSGGLIREDRGLRSSARGTGGRVVSFTSEQGSVGSARSCFEVETSGCDMVNRLRRSQGIFIVSNCVPRRSYRGLRELYREISMYCIRFNSISRRGTPMGLGGDHFTTPTRDVMGVCSPPSRNSVSPAPLLTFFFCFFFKVVFSSTNCKLLVMVKAKLTVGLFGPSGRVQGALGLFRCYNISAFF